MPNKGEEIREKAGTRLMTGIFVGYKLRPGCEFKGEDLVYSLDAFTGVDLQAEAPAVPAYEPHVTNHAVWMDSPPFFPLKQKYEIFNRTIEGLDEHNIRERPDMSISHEDHTRGREEFESQFTKTIIQASGSADAASGQNPADPRVQGNYQEGGSSSSSGSGGHPAAGPPAQVPPAAIPPAESSEPSLLETRKLEPQQEERQYKIDSHGRRYEVGPDGYRRMKTNRPLSCPPDVWHSLNSKDKVARRRGEVASSTMH